MGPEIGLQGKQHTDNAKASFSTSAVHAKPRQQNRKLRPGCPAHASRSVLGPP